MKTRRYYTGFKGESCGFYFEVNKHLFDHHSTFQHIEVVETAALGRVLLLDNEVMTTEWDGFVYPEMIVHPALVSHPRPRSVAIIGGGDGGAVTEACRHPDIEDIILCELDEQVVVAAREFFPKLAAGLNDSRAQCLHQEGNSWLAEQSRRFDVIAVDGTDPVGSGIALFAEEFYQHAAEALRPGGIYVQQIESPFYSLKKDVVALDLFFEDIVVRARKVFNRVEVYCATVPTYFGSYWAFLYAGDEGLSTEPLSERWTKIEGQTRFYSPDVHRAAFVLPPFVENLLKKK